MILLSCGDLENQGIREEMLSRHGEPDSIWISFGGGYDMCLYEFWDYEPSGLRIRLKNCGFGFYLVDQNHRAITEEPDAANSRYIFSKDPKVMRAWLMKMYGRPQTIRKVNISGLDYAPVINECWIYSDKPRVLYIQDEAFFYKEEYDEGYK